MVAYRPATSYWSAKASRRAALRLLTATRSTRGSAITAWACR